MQICCCETASDHCDPVLLIDWLFNEEGQSTSVSADFVITF